MKDIYKGREPSIKELFSDILDGMSFSRQKKGRGQIKLKKAKLSIQCSSHHYCTPREYLEDIEDYSEVEIALFDYEDNWLQPRTNKILSSFKRLNELIEVYEEGDTCVGAYVPLDLVNDLKEYLNQ